MSKHSVFHWFADACIRPDEIVAFSETLEGLTEVLLRNGKQLRATMSPVEFAEELERWFSYD